MTPIAHPHAALMALYAQDAAETFEPWRRWENRNAGTPWAEWSAQVDHPEWNPALQYRRKPKTLRIGEFDVPEPWRMPLESGQKYYAVNFGVDNSVAFFPWAGDGCDFRFLEAGVLHLTREAAELHARALISLTEQK